MTPSDIDQVYDATTRLVVAYLSKPDRFRHWQRIARTVWAQSVTHAATSSVPADERAEIVLTGLLQDWADTEHVPSGALLDTLGRQSLAYVRWWQIATWILESANTTPF